MNQGVGGPEQSAEIIERMQQEPVHQRGDRDSGQRIEPDHPPAWTISIGHKGETQRGGHHQKVGLGGEVAEETPYPDGCDGLTVAGSSQTPSQSWMNCKPREKAAIANVAPKQNWATPSLLTNGSYTRTPSRSLRSVSGLGVAKIRLNGATRSSSTASRPTLY